MSRYVLIESRDPFDSRDCDWLFETALGLTDSGAKVTVYMIQNGVLAARKHSAYADRLTTLASAKVEVLADSFSLRERAISEQKLVSDVQESDVDHLVELIMEDGSKPIWH
ncbi:MAG: DsrH/TusB family sulfur relay protein [Proteobacteria bacterium]|nr:DsrH/TusB family sulfur relay protein [Pseudomonadota bacterium]